MLNRDQLVTGQLGCQAEVFEIQQRVAARQGFVARKSAGIGAWYHTNRAYPIRRYVPADALETAKARIAELEGLLHGANNAIDTRQARIAELESERLSVSGRLCAALSRDAEASDGPLPAPPEHE